MEKFIDTIYNRSSKVVKLRSPNGSVSSLMMKYVSSSSQVDPFSPPSIMSSSSSDSNSNSISPLSAVADEDVLVMDGILVSSSGSSSKTSANTGFYKTELCRSWEDSGKCRFNNNCQFAHGKEDLRPTRFPINKNKSEVMTDTPMMKTQTTPPIKLKHAIKTPIAIGLEHTTRTPITPTILTFQQTSNSPTSITKTVQNSETPISTTKTVQISENPITAIKLEQTSKSPTSITQTLQTSENPSSITKTVQTSKTTTTTTKLEQTSKSPTSITKTEKTNENPFTAIPSKDYWSPLDDDIEVTLPFQSDKPPTREEVESYIQSHLYTPTPRKRLPVFTEIFPD